MWEKDGVVIRAFDCVGSIESLSNNRDNAHIVCSQCSLLGSAVWKIREIRVFICIYMIVYTMWIEWVAAAVASWLLHRGTSASILRSRSFRIRSTRVFTFIGKKNHFFSNILIFASITWHLIYTHTHVRANKAFTMLNFH